MKLNRMQAVLAMLPWPCPLLVTGCAVVENFLCSNRVAIEGDVSVAQAAIAAVQAEYGNRDPA